MVARRDDNNKKVPTGARPLRRYFIVTLVFFANFISSRTASSHLSAFYYICSITTFIFDRPLGALGREGGALFQGKKMILSSAVHDDIVVEVCKSMVIKKREIARESNSLQLRPAVDSSLFNCVVVLENLS